MSNMSPEQIVGKLFDDLAVALEPARLKMNHANGHTLGNELRKQGKTLLTANVQDLLAVINQILLQEKLEWEPGFEPAKLKFQQQQAKPEKAVKQVDFEREREAAARKQEADAATKKLDEASIKQARELIGGYLPMKRMGRIDYVDQAAMQKAWSAALDAEIATNGNLQEFATALASAIQKRYADREKIAERM
jgi:hypothetical protein